MRYDAKTALIVVDVQNDFADPKGSLYVKGGEEVARSVNGEIAGARASGGHVVFTQDWHPESTPHFEKDGGVWPAHCVQGTWGAEFHPTLDVGDEPVVRKGADGKDGYSGFSVRDPLSEATADTQLEALLRERGIERVVVGGLATDYCVKETVLDAIKRGFDTTLLTRAISAVDLDPGDGDRAVSAMVDAGAHLE